MVDDSPILHARIGYLDAYMGEVHGCLVDVIMVTISNDGWCRQRWQTGSRARCVDQEKILANGFCASCYSLKRQDAEYFGGLREAVLERDGYRCRICDAPGGRKGEMIVHHRVPGKSVLALVIALCPGCHAKVHRTRRFLPHGPICCWSCGANSTLPAMSKPRWIST